MRGHRLWWAVAYVLLTAGVASGCQETAPKDPGPLAVELRKVADLREPTVMAVRPRDDRIYVGEKGGLGLTVNVAVPKLGAG